MNLTEADKRRLRDAFAVRASLNGSLMNYIGLGEVRERFPEMWKRNRARILATARAILQQYTDARADVVVPIDDASFVVVFAQLDRQEAMLRAALIKSEILRRFMGDEALGALDMRVQAMEIGSGAILGGTLRDLLSAAATAAAGPAETAASRSGGEADRASRDGTKVRADTTIGELAKRFEFSFDDLEFGFQPYLQTARDVFSLYAGQAVRYSATGDILTSYDVLPREPDLEQVALLDQMVLMRARHGLVEMASRKRVSIVLVPVSFETMTSRNHAADYLAMLQKIPSDLRNYLVPNLCRCPSGVPEGRLAEILGPLKRLSRSVGMRLGSPKQPLSVVKAAGALTAGFSISGGSGAEFGAPVFVERFGAAARKQGLSSFVDGVDTPEQMDRCRAVRIDYLGGRAIAELSDYVGPLRVVQSS